MNEKPIPWWRKALNYALGGIRSGFGLFAKPADPAPLEPPLEQAAPLDLDAPIEEEAPLNRTEPLQEVEDALTDRIANPESVSAAAQSAIYTGASSVEKPEAVNPLLAVVGETPSPIDYAQAATQVQTPELEPAVEALHASAPDPVAEHEPVAEPIPNDPLPTATEQAPDPQIDSVPEAQAFKLPAAAHPIEPASKAGITEAVEAETEAVPGPEVEECAVTPIGPIEPIEPLPVECAAQPEPEPAAESAPIPDSAIEGEPVVESTIPAEVLSDTAPERPSEPEPAIEPAPVIELAAESVDLPSSQPVDPPVEEPIVIVPAASELAGIQQSAAPPVPEATVPTVVAPSAWPTSSEDQATAEPAAKQAATPVDAEKAAAKIAAMQKRRDQASEDSPFSVSVSQVYDGPLDLLLDLIRQQDIDIYDIPIAKITSQFLAYVDQLKATDVDVAGEFIYTASLLIHIKSKMLLPRSPAGPGDAPEEDPRRELVERLLEHERFKNAAQMLQQKQMLEAATWTNPGQREFQNEDESDSEIAADTVDLVRIFRDILERARNRPVIDVGEDTVTVGQMIQFLARRLTMEDKPVALRRLLGHTRSERALVAMFLALLELVRLQAVLLRQDRAFSDIFIKKHTGFDAVMNQGITNALDDWR
jgi:segregation and condensation protein A